MPNPRQKRQVEDLLRLDVGALQRAGALKAGSAMAWGWQSQSEQVARIDLHADTYQLRLCYRTRSKDDDWKDVAEVVTVEWRTQPRGGMRAYFRCPGCDNRVSRLYGADLFRCRVCHGLNYASQQNAHGDADLDLSRRLREELLCFEWVLGQGVDEMLRPHGMHRRTFAKKIERLRIVDVRAKAYAIEMLGSFSIP